MKTGEKTYYEYRATALAILGFGLIIIISFVSFQIAKKYLASAEMSNHSDRVLTQMNRVRLLIETADSSQRGFIITEDRSFLQPYVEAKVQIISRVEELINLVRDNPVQLELAQKLYKLIDEKITHMEISIHKVHEGHTKAAVDYVKKGLGQAIMQEIRGGFKIFEENEIGLLRERQAAAQVDFQSTTQVVIFGLALVFFFFAGVIFFLRSSIERGIQIQNELMIANTKATEVSEIKSQFLANMSHEIRTPLNGIIGMCQLVLKTDLQENQRSNVEVIRDASQALMVLINQILDLSKIESGKLQLEEVHFELRSLVQSAIAFVGYSAQIKGIRIVFNVSSNVPQFFLADSLRVRQILLNLISNAIKFSEKGGEVDVKIFMTKQQDSKTWIRFEVSDKGIGIDEATQKKLFTEFTQGDQSTTRKYGGTGLGLAICRQLVQMMQGHIGVESKLNQGSIFYFEVPLRVAKYNLFDDDLEKTPKKTMDSRSQNNSRILVVEDNLINQKVIQSMLSNLGYDFHVEDNGQKAIDYLKSNQVQLVIMDCHMPVMDGYECSKRIRLGECGEKNRKLPIVASTANAIKGDFEKCLQMGMNDYISKPIKMDELEMKLEKWNETRGGQLSEQKLKQLRDLSAKTLSDVVNLFRKTFPETVVQMRKAHVDHDGERVRELAHNLKSSCGNVGAVTLMDICQRIEKTADLDHEQILTMLEALDINFLLIEGELFHHAANSRKD